MKNENVDVMLAISICVFLVLVALIILIGINHISDNETKQVCFNANKSYIDFHKGFIDVEYCGDITEAINSMDNLIKSIKEMEDE